MKRTPIKRRAALRRTISLSRQALHRRYPFAHGFPVIPKSGSRASRAAQRAAIRNFSALFGGVGICARCFNYGPRDAHHILPRSRGGTHDAKNGVGLCRKCHMAVHAHAPDWRNWIVTRKGAV